MIDQHYRENHAESVNDELILLAQPGSWTANSLIELVRGEFEYFTAEPVQYADKPYRLVSSVYRTIIWAISILTSGTRCCSRGSYAQLRFPVTKLKEVTGDLWDKEKLPSDARRAHEHGEERLAQWIGLSSFPSARNS